MNREPDDATRSGYQRIRTAPLHRWAQLGVVVELLALVRILAEYFRLRASQPATFTFTEADRWVGGALLAILTVLLLLAYKLVVFGPLP
jgi:hypothetical protein